MFRADRGARTGVPHIVVVLTDGGSNDKARTQQEAYRLRNAGVHVIVIALGDWLDHMELMNMASYPHKRYLKYVEDFETLDSIREDIRDLMCNRRCIFFNFLLLFIIVIFVCIIQLSMVVRASGVEFILHIENIYNIYRFVIGRHAVLSLNAVVGRVLELVLVLLLFLCR